MRRALIGHTGFIGSNIAARTPFDDVYNSTNIGDLAGRDYDLVVCAAGRADSYRINGDGPADRAELDALADVVSSARIGKLVLISTVCVYPGDTSPDESTPPDPAALAPYGANRVRLELRLRAIFDTLILRLPQLYGPGLKKGVVYDLLTDHRVEYLDPEAAFQFYDLRLLWAHLTAALDAGVPALNIATPPLTCAAVAAEVFGRDLRGQVPPGPANPFARMYTRDMRTRHFGLFGGPPGYLMSREESLERLRDFVAGQR